VFEKYRNAPEFKKFAHKIHYSKIEHRDCADIIVGYHIEKLYRKYLIGYSRKAGAKDEDLFLMTDTDELVRKDSIQLLKDCEFGDRIHLALDSYLYSFEFRQWPEITYRGHISVIGRLSDKKITYRFGDYLTDNILGDSGWHCSWCVRSVDSLMAKLVGYTHSDRLAHDSSLADRENFMKRICNGEDPYGYLPEASTYQRLFSLWKLQSIQGVTNAPEWAQRNPERFRFLLPGGCRER
jgi:beta-1,4-mannosyl-glycoprotein beta-1,4-N-acetylglucosaminyltransferase